MKQKYSIYKRKYKDARDKFILHYPIIYLTLSGIYGSFIGLLIGKSLNKITKLNK